MQFWFRRTALGIPAEILPVPGGDVAPYTTCAACDHAGCVKDRALAAQPCAVCGEPIGYNRRFYEWSRTGPRPPAHEACLLAPPPVEQLRLL